MLFLNTMSTQIFAHNVVNHDHHREIHIDARGANVSDIVRAAMTEDITPVQEEAQIDLFKYIHVGVTSEQERQNIHKIVGNIVRLPKMKQICDELYLLIRDKKVLSTITPEAMLAELRRMGMPSADEPGFSDQNFYSNYKA